jgi:hypothetical protein
MMNNLTKRIEQSQRPLLKTIFAPSRCRIVEDDEMK